MRTFEPQPEMVFEEMTQSIAMTFIQLCVISWTETATVLRLARHLNLLKKSLELLPVLEVKSLALITSQTLFERLFGHSILKHIVT